MSGDQLASSFGNPNAQPPPTPKQTPTSAIFPSPAFETPKNTQGHFEEAGGWTPRFAEEYSVFNSTPGNLRGSSGPFVDFTPLTPYQPAPAVAVTAAPAPAAVAVTGHKRPLSAEGIAAEIATHVNHFSPHPNLPLPPVDPAKRLQSSPGPLSTTFDQAYAQQDQLSSCSSSTSSQERLSKRARRGTVARDVPSQTATPPPSARKGDRKLAPSHENITDNNDNTTDTMQNDQGFGQPDFSGAAQQQNMGAFVTNPGDIFGYPLSAPATAPTFADQRVFWETDASMVGMDIDFGAGAGAPIFQSPAMGHRHMDSLDWAKSNQMFQESGVMPEVTQEHVSPTKRERPLAPKPVNTNIGTTVGDPSMYVGAYSAPVDNAFGIVGNGGGVNPGLLFSRPPSSSMEMAHSNPPLMQAPMVPTSSAELPLSLAGQVPLVSQAPMRGELRRSASVKELGPSKQTDRLATSPIKAHGRPGLSRSFSENRGKKALPLLAPAAPRAQPSGPSPTNGKVNRPVVAQPSRPSGRSSPLKGHHHRLSSLSSIPESGPRTRTQAKFMIDANGRARVETTVIVEGGGRRSPPSLRKRHSVQPIVQQQQLRRRWNSSDEGGDDDDDSSTDEEPIIIPSRNTSFALPDPRKATPRRAAETMSMHLSFNSHHHQAQRSISEHSTTTSFGGTFPASSQDDDPESEAETVMNDATPTGKTSGDAASELRKLRESRQRQQASASKQLGQRRAMTLPNGLGIAGFATGGGYSGQGIMSPTTMTDTSLPTPSTQGRSYRVRCVCNRHEVDQHGEDFMVQCESCEMWQHSACVKVTKRASMSSIYICAFCAKTPGMHGSASGNRMRDAGRSMMGPPGVSTSPLAHKSFKSFR